MRIGDKRAECVYEQVGRLVNVSRNLARTRKPSLVCDLMELYRYLIDNFLIKYRKSLRKKDFTIKQEARAQEKKSYK